MRIDHVGAMPRRVEAIERPQSVTQQVIRANTRVLGSLGLWLRTYKPIALVNAEVVSSRTVTGVMDASWWIS
jgi:hypothetical protein